MCCPKGQEGGGGGGGRCSLPGGRLIIIVMPVCVCPCLCNYIPRISIEEIG